MTDPYTAPTQKSMPPTQPPTRVEKKPPFTLRGIVQGMTAEGRKSAVLYKHPQTQGLGVRVTPSGVKSFVFDRSVNGKTLRMTLGPAPRSFSDSGALTVPEAESMAKLLNAEIAAGRDPRAVKLERAKADADSLSAERLERDRLGITLRMVWEEFVQERSLDWGDRHHADAISVASPGGEPYKRGKGKTKPGPLATLMREPVATIDQDLIADWAKIEGQRRATRARLARRHLIACLRWCMEEGPREWRSLVQPEALRLTKTAQRRLGRAQAKGDRLERTQLRQFFWALGQLTVPVTRDYIAFLLITGARKNEATQVQWSDIDWRWKRMRLHDKATQDHRNIPVPPYLEQLLRDAQRRNESLPEERHSDWVFASNRKHGEPLKWANNALAEVSEAAGIPRLSIHGLRRSYAALAESAGLPAGAIAQMMGHSPQAIAEKHYRRRSVDELAEYANRWEAWLLDAAGVEFQPGESVLRLVKG